MHSVLHQRGRSGIPKTNSTYGQGEERENRWITTNSHLLRSWPVAEEWEEVVKHRPYTLSASTHIQNTINSKIVRKQVVCLSKLGQGMFACHTESSDTKHITGVR